MPKSKGKGEKPDRCRLEQEVLQAMREEAWLAPETEAEVLEAEASLAANHLAIQTPEHPRDLLHQALKIRTTQSARPTPDNTKVSENLARAAREGGVISPETNERMKEDRDAAERKDGDK
jgi:hypothetical protein